MTICDPFYEDANTATDYRGAFFDEGDSDCSVTVTVPQGRKFIVLDLWEQYWQVTEDFYRCDEKPGACQADIDLEISASSGGQLYQLRLSADAAGAPPTVPPAWQDMGLQERDELSTWRVYERSRLKVFDVETLARNQPITVTVRVIGHQYLADGYLHPLSVAYTIYGNSRFTLTETPKSFRARATAMTPRLIASVTPAIAT